MSYYFPGCTVTITDPACSMCPEKELGDVRGFALIKDTFTFTDITDPTEWTNGISSKDIFVFPLSTGSIEMAEQTSDGLGDNEIDFDGYDFTAQVKDPNYQSNWGFWNTAKNARNFWRFAWRTETLVHISDNTVTVIPKQPVAAGNKKAKIMWDIMVRFSQDALARPYDMPTGIFDQCVQEGAG